MGGVRAPPGFSEDKLAKWDYASQEWKIHSEVTFRDTSVSYPRGAMVLDDSFECD